MARNEPWEGTGPSGILVFVTQPDTEGSPCAFPAKPIRFGKLLKRIYLTSPSHNWPDWRSGSAGLFSPAAACPERCGLRPLALAQVEQPPPVPPGVALRRQRPRPPLQNPAGRNPLLRAPAPLGAYLVAFRPAGPGHRPHPQGAIRPPPSSSASSTGAAPFPWPGASTAPPSAAPGWIPPWNCSRNWPQPFPRK